MIQLKNMIILKYNYLLYFIIVQFYKYYVIFLFIVSILQFVFLNMFLLNFIIGNEKKFDVKINELIYVKYQTTNPMILDDLEKPVCCNLK